MRSTIEPGLIYRIGWIAPVMAVLVGQQAVAQDFEFSLIARQFDVADGQELDLFRGVALNDLGNVAYTAIAIDDQGELTGSALLVDHQRLAATGDTIASGRLGFVGPPSVNSTNGVAYSADVFVQGSGLSNTAAVSGDRSDRSTHTLMVGRGNTVDGVVLDGALDPAINATGDLAFTGVYFDANLDLQASGIFHNGQTVAATGDLVGNQFVIDVVGSPSLNDRGDLAFKASLIDLVSEEASTGIFINGQLTALSGQITDGLHLTEVLAPSVNNPGDLVYVGRYFDTDVGFENTAIIFNGQAVITSGDTTPDGLILDRVEDVSVNAAGQLAFVATFIDPQGGTLFEQGVFLTTPPPGTPGDANGDGRVDAVDLNILALSWQQEVVPATGADFNGDGFIDAGDLNELALNWQSGVSGVLEISARAATVSVPEPSVMLSWGAGGLILLRRRPRRRRP